MAISLQKDDLQTILNACVRAATASARQAYSAIVVEDRAVARVENSLPTAYERALGLFTLSPLSKGASIGTY